MRPPRAFIGRPPNDPRAVALACVACALALLGLWCTGVLLWVR